MEGIIYFEENPKKNGVIRFVSKYQRKRFLRRESIAYSSCVFTAPIFTNEEIIERVFARVRKDYPDAKIYCTYCFEFVEKYKTHRFWMIARYGGKSSNEPDAYFSAIIKKDVVWTQYFEDAELWLDREKAEEAVKTIRQASGERIALSLVYLNLINCLLTPVMMIVCTSKSGKKEMKYLSKIEGNRLRLVNTSDSAMRLTFADAQETFDHLVSNNKNFHYAVLPAFKENVFYKDIEKYVYEKKISRKVALTMKLKYLQRKG